MAECRYSSYEHYFEPEDYFELPVQETFFSISTDSYVNSPVFEPAAHRSVNPSCESMPDGDHPICGDR